MCGPRGGGLGACVWGASLHHKKVVPILGILSTDATYYLLFLLSFKFVFVFLGGKPETHERGAAQYPQ